MKNFKILSVILMALTGISVQQTTTTCGKANPQVASDCTSDTTNASNDCCFYTQSGKTSACVSIGKTADLAAFSNSTYMGWATLNCPTRNYVPAASQSTCGYAFPTAKSQCLSYPTNSTFSCCHVASPDMKTSYCMAFDKVAGNNDLIKSFISAFGAEMNCSSSWTAVSSLLFIIFALLF